MTSGKTEIKILSHIPLELSRLMLISVLFSAANFCNSEIVESAGNMMLVNFLTDNEGDGKN